MNTWFRKVIGMAAPAAAPILELPADDLTTGADDAADDAADRRTEKDRIKAIMCCAETAGREALATHLALSTNLSFEDAKSALSASPRKSETPEPTDATASVRTARTRQLDANFIAAFNRGEYAIPESPGEPVSEVARIRANYALAQGLPPRKSI